MSLTHVSAWRYSNCPDLYLYVIVHFLLTYSMLLRDVIMTSYCCQRYAECLVIDPAGQCTGALRRTRVTVELLRQETPNFLAPNL